MLYISPTNLHLPAAKQEPYHEAYPFTKHLGRLSNIYIVERTNMAEIRPEEQSEKAEKCRENFLK